MLSINRRGEEDLRTKIPLCGLEIKEKADAVYPWEWGIEASVWPRVVGHCINIESKLGVPTVPLIISEFMSR